MRKDPLANNYCYHIFNRSIANFKVFNDQNDSLRFLEIMDLCRFSDFIYKYSNFLALSPLVQQSIIKKIKSSNNLLVEMIAYCLMPTHPHLILRQVSDKGISRYVARIFNSYTRYFNIKYHRKGPLWEGKFQSRLIQTDEILLHITRYLHLNPTSAGLVKKPQDWQFSSYHEYIDSDLKKDKLCNFQDLISLNSNQYKKFVNDQVDYQKELSKIKYLIIEDYSG